jgi:hypothetical protein
MVATTRDTAGTMSRSRVVANATAGSVVVRRVDTKVPAAIRTGTSWCEDSRNDTSARAAAGGNRLTPSSSRNLT